MPLKNPSFSGTLIDVTLMTTCCILSGFKRSSEGQRLVVMVSDKIVLDPKRHFLKNSEFQKWSFKANLSENGRIIQLT